MRSPTIFAEVSRDLVSTASQWAQVIRTSRSAAMSGRQIARASRRFRSGRVGFVLIMLASWVCRALRGAAFIPLYGSKTAPRKESSRMASVAPVRPESLMSSHLGLAGGCLCGALASCSVETGYPEAQFINFTMFGGMAIDNLAQACFSCVALVMKGVVFLSLAGWRAVAAIVECLLALPCSHVGLGSCCTASVIWPLIQQWSSYALNELLRASFESRRCFFRSSARRDLAVDALSLRSRGLHCDPANLHLWHEAGVSPAGH